jgi:ParB family chromosome partitioning protein
MELLDVPVEMLREAPWNPNEADEATLRRLGASLARFGLVDPLVIRSVGDAYEVLSGNQRLKVLREQGASTVPCVEVQADDARARLLAQALNRVHGEDDLNRKAALVKDLLAAMSAEEIASVLPDSAEALRGLASIREANPASLAEQVSGWAAVERAKAESGLHVTSFSLSYEQKDAVERAVGLMLPRLGTTEAPNRRGIALAEVCREWAAGRGYRADHGRRDERRKAVSPQRTQRRGRRAPAAVSQEPTQGGGSDE